MNSSQAKSGDTPFVHDLRIKDVPLPEAILRVRIYRKDADAFIKPPKMPSSPVTNPPDDAIDSGYHPSPPSSSYAGTHPHLDDWDNPYIIPHLNDWDNSYIIPHRITHTSFHFTPKKVEPVLQPSFKSDFPFLT